MIEIFLEILKMSFIASYVIGIVFIIRIFVRRISALMAYVLWGVVLFRLICPFSIEGNLSLIPTWTREYINDSLMSSSNRGEQENHIIAKDESQRIVLSPRKKQEDSMAKSSLLPPLVDLSKEPILKREKNTSELFFIEHEEAIRKGMFIWLVGVGLMATGGISCYWKLKRKLKGATLVKNNIFETDTITAPFVLGIIKPRIYLPLSLQGQNIEYILKHEEKHIKRKDYLILPIAFMTLCIHWFNPFVWLSYKVMLKDMELSCDEAVLKGCKMEVRLAYCKELLELSKRQSTLLSPLSFGESHTKARIKRILKNKTPVFGVNVLGVIVGIVGMLGLGTNPSIEEITPLPIQVKLEASPSPTSLVEKAELKELTEKSSKTSEAIRKLEENLAIIMSSPLESSNPQHYIEAHEKEYEEILKYSMSEETLTYMLTEFEEGHAEGLRGQLLMRLCKEILGDRDNVSEELSPKEWFSKLKVREEVILPDFNYEGKDELMKIIYETTLQKKKLEDTSFTIVAPYIVGKYEEENKIKVIIKLLTHRYHLYDKTLSNVSGSMGPVAITYTKNPDGTYILSEYVEAMDGGMYRSSIEAFCTQPVSHKPIPEMVEQLLGKGSSSSSIQELERQNLIKHLQKNKQYGVIYHTSSDEYIPLT